MGSDPVRESGLSSEYFIPGAGRFRLCFVTWNFAVKRLGAVRTSIYIYMVPVITLIASVLILHEPFTWMTGTGMFLTLAGLLLSEYKTKK